MDNTICHFDIPCDDPEAAGKFYAELFGWKVVPVPNMEGEYLLVQTSSEPGALGGGLCKRGNGHESPFVYVMVEDIDASTKTLKELGGTVVTDKAPIPQVGYIVTAKDPQGNSIGLLQEDKEAE
jgi:uncharacterized protein